MWRGETRAWAPTLVALAVLLSCNVARAQRAWWRHVYRITATECPAPPAPQRRSSAPATTRVQTGFKLARFRGIITALHGVAGCDDIRAQPAAEGPTIDLTIKYADESQDLAYLVLDGESGRLSPDPLPVDDGLTLSTTASSEVSPLERLVIAGFPLGAEGLVVTPVDASDPPHRELWEPVGAHIATAFARRGSPSHLARVVSLSDSLAPGHSGAPLLRISGRGASLDSPVVVGMGDGGIDDARAGISWAMSAQAIRALLAGRPRITRRRWEELGADFSVTGFTTSHPIDAHQQRELENARSWRTVAFDIGVSAVGAFQLGGAAAVGFNLYGFLTVEAPTSSAHAFLFRAGGGVSEVWSFGAYVGPDRTRTQPLSSDHAQLWGGVAVGGHFLRDWDESISIDVGARVGVMVFEEDWRMALTFPLTGRVFLGTALLGNTLYVEAQLAATYSRSFDLMYTGFLADVSVRELQWGVMASAGVGGAFCVL